MQNILQAGDLLNIQNTTQELTAHNKIPDRLKTKHHPRLLFLLLLLNLALTKSRNSTVNMVGKPMTSPPALQSLKSSL